MEYIVDKSILFPLVDEEVSRVANETYSEDGTSLYDTIVITENDKPTIGRMMDDAVNTFVKRAQDIVRYEKGKLTFIRIPDFDESLTAPTEQEITRYIVLNTCAAWFQSRNRDKVEEFTLRGQTAMDKAIAYLKTIKHPTR